MSILIEKSPISDEVGPAHALQIQGKSIQSVLVNVEVVTNDSARVGRASGILGFRVNDQMVTWFS